MIQYPTERNVYKGLFLLPLATIVSFECTVPKIVRAQQVPDITLKHERKVTSNEQIQFTETYQRVCNFFKIKQCNAIIKQPNFLLNSLLYSDEVLYGYTIKQGDRNRIEIATHILWESVKAELNAAEISPTLNQLTFIRQNIRRKVHTYGWHTIDPQYGHYGEYFNHTYGHQDPQYAIYVQFYRNAEPSILVGKVNSETYNIITQKIQSSKEQKLITYNVFYLGSHLD